MVQPRSSDFWAADPATGELALRPLALPYPLCHTCVGTVYCAVLRCAVPMGSTQQRRRRAHWRSLLMAAAGHRRLLH